MELLQGGHGGCGKHSKSGKFHHHFKVIDWQIVTE
jgi:hypothetical protein